LINSITFFHYTQSQYIEYGYTPLIYAMVTLIILLLLFITTFKNLKNLETKKRNLTSA